jgi:hypothetical protein
MSKRKVSDLFHIRDRFLRSAHLERDFYDSSALSGYVVTDFAKACLNRVASGLRPRSGNRAWRMTGDYGSGKSSFALLLAHWFAGNGNGLPLNIRRAIDLQQKEGLQPQLLPVLVTCSRQGLGLSILHSLDEVLSQVYGRSSKLKLGHEVHRLVRSKHQPSDNQIFRLIGEINARVIADSKAKGLLLILDELGKFLEFAALHPEKQDVFLLQRLAEAAARSGSEPLFVISLLHQGFNAYADHLNQTAQREWEKVASRFEEIVFNQPIEQAATIISSAINVQTAELPKTDISEIKAAMERTVALGWLASAPVQSLVDSAVKLYPLHPTVLPLVVRTFRRFGQNERSLFSFLLSNEPFGLQAFAERQVRDCDLYRLHNFYDYVRANFGHRFSVQSYRSHWNLIDSVVESFAGENELELHVLKTVGILNLLNDADLVANESSIICALLGLEGAQEKQIRRALSALHKVKRILYDRGSTRGFCLWPHTSVDLEKAYEDACRAIDTPLRVSSLLKDSLVPRPIVARRHYIETGSLRYCDVRYCSVPELPSLLEPNVTLADGLIAVPLCETLTERKTALDFAKHSEIAKRSNWLVAIPQPLNNLAALVQEVQRWEWVSTNTLELNADKYAREEVSIQKAAAHAQLEKRTQHFIGWKQLNSQTTLEWFCGGRPLKIKTGRQLLEELSRIFDETYTLTPRVQNELVNRRALSSAAAAARMRLIERMFISPTAPLLGMDETKKPPEMSIYLSVLKFTGIHQQSGDSWRISEPHPGSDHRHVLPAFQRMRDVLQQKLDNRVNVADLFEELRKPPYGLRDGIIPILLTAFAIAHDKDIAFYKDGSFLRELNSEAILVLTKAPERFEIQYCKIEGVRAKLFETLLSVLEIRQPQDRSAELLDVVKELCMFVAQLPSYVHYTKQMSATALGVREAILNAREPSKLLFTDLPASCGFLPIETDAMPGRQIQLFVKTLKSALDELRAVYPGLEERLKKELQGAFGLSDYSQISRGLLAARAQKILITVTEPKLRAFCLRLLDDKLPDSEWLESIGSYVALKPPSKWHDEEENLFNAELAQLATRFRRVENISFTNNKEFDRGLAVRLAITQVNGVEHEQVVHFDVSEEQQLNELQIQFSDILAKNRRLGLAAASRAIWDEFEKRS